MTFEKLKETAVELTTALQPLSKQNLHLCAVAMSQSSQWPNRIVVSGIKCLRKTGKFSATERQRVNSIIHDICDSSVFVVKILDADPCMHNAVISVI